MIEPLHGGKSVAEVTALLIEDELRTGDKLLRRAISRYLPQNSDQESAWKTAVHDGFLPQPVLAKQDATPSGEQLEALFGSFSVGMVGYSAVAVIALVSAALSGQTSRVIVFKRLRKLS